MTVTFNFYFKQQASPINSAIFNIWFQLNHSSMDMRINGMQGAGRDTNTGE